MFLLSHHNICSKIAQMVIHVLWHHCPVVNDTHLEMKVLVLLLYIEHEHGHIVGTELTFNCDQMRCRVYIL